MADTAATQSPGVPSGLSTALESAVRAVTPIEPSYERTAQQKLDGLTKPVGSLGRLEEIARRLYAIQKSEPLRAEPARMVTIAGDHGVVAEGVTSNPQAVTRIMVHNFLRGGAGINALCAAAGAQLMVVDAGAAGGDFAPHPMLVRAKIAPGTANMAKGPAMSREQCLAALDLGLTLAARAADEGVRVLGTGEMGIGNTTPSSALFCAYFGCRPEEMTGMGAGLGQGGLTHKQQIIARSLEANAAAVSSGDPVATLAALGGFEIAALAGLIIGASARRLAVAVDGFISTAAYAAASRIAPAVEGYCFFSHASAESGHARALEKLGQKPLLDLGLRLGEGTGAALCFHLLKAAAAAYNTMASFDDPGMDAG